MTRENFFKTTTGKAIEKALWEIAVIALGVWVILSQDASMAWMIPYTPLMLALTKYINVNKLK